MFRTPPHTPRKVQTPRGAKVECSDENGSEANAPSPSVKDEQAEVFGTVYSLSKRSVKTTVTSASSTSARRRQLELDAEAAKAKLRIEAAEAEAKAAKIKSDIQVELINKKLAADVADLESHHSSGKPSVASSIRSKVNNWIDKSAVEPESHPAGQSDIKLLACALKDAVAASSSQHHQQLLTRMSTSKDLPLYCGDPLDWLQFKEAYLSSTKLCKYSDSENVWRLRKCLRGEAKEAVTSLLIGGISPDVIIETLELRFGKPESIMNKIVIQLKKIHPLPLTFHNELVCFAVKVRNCVTAAIAMKQNDYLRSPELVSIVASKLPTVLLNKWTDYYYENKYSSNNYEIPRLELLSNFLYLEANKIASAGVSHIHTQSIRKPDHRETRHGAHAVLYTTNNNQTDDPACKFCLKSAHKLAACPRFKRAMRKDRWRFARTSKLCYKCLTPRHNDPASCSASNCNIEGCDQPHHRLLHWVKPSDNKSTFHEKVELENENSDADVNHETVNHTVASLNPKVLLKIVPLTVHGPAGTVHAHALLDDGATVTLIAAELADKLGLHGKSEIMRARSAWDNGELICETQIINVKITNSENQNYCVRARKIKSLNLPVQILPNIDFTKYGLKSNFGYKNMCSCDVQPMLLIGQDNHDLIAPVQCYRSKQREPYVTQTALGWCVHGSSVSVLPHNSNLCVSLTHDCPDNTCLQTVQSNVFHLCVVQPVQPAETVSEVAPPCGSTLFEDCEHRCAQLHEEVRKSFLLDSIGVGTKPRRNPEDVRAVSILDQTAELRKGQWYVGLPWKSDNHCLPDSYSNAFRRLKSIQKKMLSNSDYASRYHERMSHLFTNKYAKELVGSFAQECTERVWYLPHFGVDNPNKRKLRLVFDAAAQSSNCSLNDFLLQGPDLLQSLLGIMLRFRENSIGLIGDIQDMFLRIKIRDEDVHAFRFLWQDGFLPGEEPPLGPNKNPKPEDSPIKQCVMTSLIFGANCSPFVAQYINQIKNTERFEQTMPHAVQAIRKNQYMDNYIDSVSDICVAKKMIKEISQINQQGGFNMRDWLSNNFEVLSETPKEILSDKAVRFNVENQPERTLGLLWFPESDSFGFDLSLKRIPKDILDSTRKPSKRELLRIIMSIYDMHGFLSPFTVKSKIIMQEVWKVGIKWDDLIPDNLFTLFQEWLLQLPTICAIRIPRWYFKLDASETTIANTGAGASELQLHLFGDASPRIFASVAYWRKVDSAGQVQVSFIACKNRVAPLKSVTIPRLELQGALLACRLAETIRKEHRIKPAKTFYWIDSTVVLHWIRNDHRNYKTFIANRLGEIDEYSKISEWNYVPSELNMADLATKITDYDLRSNSSWFKGPFFLYENPDRWPQQPETLQTHINKDDLEEIHTIYHTYTDTYVLPVPDADRFSSWIRLLRCTATVLLFISKCRKNKTRFIDSELMNRAEVLLLRHSQSQSFRREIDLLNKNKEINVDSRLRTLTPFVDSDGLLRVDGRIDAVRQVDDQIKNPIILDGRHRVTRLIVHHYHERVAHSFNELVVNELRQKYWIVNLRPTVRTVASQCLFCRIRKATPRPPRLGDLPIERLTHHQRPFTMCGVDLFGPVEVTVGRQRQKRYGVLFTCLTVRAVHIEVVHTLTADSLIMSLRRMAARRGWPHTILSDNGTNLRRADVDLRKSLQDLDQACVISKALNKGVTWRFIPPASPHMGGAWERQIRTVKTALKVVLKERAPREEVFTTFLAEVENIVNSRPLTHVSVDSRSQETLTPNHFLIGSSSNLPVPGVFNDQDLFLRRQWRIAQRLADLFWSRWVKEILPVLIPRAKWNREGQQLKVGDLVIVVDPSSPRNCWPKGIVEKVYPGQDGRVRVVDIRTGTSVKKRPVARVALLPLDVERRDDDTTGEGVNDVLTRAYSDK